MSEKVFFHTAHKALWNWLSKHPEMVKEDWPGWESNGGNVTCTINQCFACEYDKDCVGCPLYWPNSIFCMLPKGIGFKFYRSCNNEERSILAAQIRDLPVREGVVCK